jgi:hypothetical protein
VDRQTQYGQHETASCLEPLYSSPCSAGVHFGPASPCTWAMFFGSPKAGRSPPVLRCRLTNSGGTQVTDQRRRSRDTALSLAGRNRGAKRAQFQADGSGSRFPILRVRPPPLPSRGRRNRQPRHDGRSLHGPWEWTHPRPFSPPASGLHGGEAHRKPQ